MPIVDLIMVLIIVGVGLYLIELVPMDGTVKQIIRIVVILALVLWILQTFGLLDALRQYRIGRG